MSKGIYLIAEIGQAHEGSLGILHSYIDAVAKTGVDAIKFQTHIAEAESSLYEPFRVKFSYEDDTRFDYWKRMGFSKDQWIGIKQHCDEVGLDFLSSPFSMAAVDLLESIGVEKYKIGSGETSNFLMLDRICETSKEIILSSGMSSFAELDKTVGFLKERGANFSILQCTTEYPTSAKTVGLNVIQELKDRYDVNVGLSDHSATIYPALSAATLGAEIIEFHVVYDREMFGPDSKSSLTLGETKELVNGVRYIEEARRNPVDKNENGQFKALKSIFEKSLAINKDVEVGHLISLEDLESKKPAERGISATEYASIVGRKLKKRLNRYDFISYEDLE